MSKEKKYEVRGKFTFGNAGEKGFYTWAKSMAQAKRKVKKEFSGDFIPKKAIIPKKAMEIKF